ncbi:MAG: hypothetical protein H0U95_01230 [Bacteroidetes bacterium]|nr:hypothetical protein [Bacteroidota bacterium]
MIFVPDNINGTRDISKTTFFLTLFCLLALNFQIKSQIIELNTVSNSIFEKYNIIFIGEQHNIDSNDRIEALLVSKIKEKDTKVLLELGYDQNYLLNNFFVKKDTLTVNLFSNNMYGSKLSRVFYNSKITPKAIDVLTKEDFTKDLVLALYSKKEEPMEVINNIKEFSEIGMMKSPYVIKNMNKYDRFLEQYAKNRELHMKFLGSDSVAIKEYFEALKATIESDCDPNVKGIGFSDFREEFMYKMVKNEIEKSVPVKIISINGSAHICLDPKAQDKRIKNKKWSPLAYKVKTNFPDKKVCSIYLLNIEKDLYFKKDHPEELKYIQEHTDLNKYYLIRLDYKESPFKNLVNMYTYIVVY